MQRKKHKGGKTSGRVLLRTNKNPRNRGVVAFGRESGRRQDGAVNDSMLVGLGERAGNPKGREARPAADAPGLAA
jgi:hypothetical protein